MQVTSPKRIAASVLGMALLGAVPAGADTLATVGPRTTTLDQVEEESAAALAQVEQSRYDALKVGLDSLVNEALLELDAEARGIPVEELVKIEVTDKVAAPTDEEIQQVYEQAKANLQGKALDEVRGQIVDYLKQLKLSTRQEEFLAELRAKYPTTTELRPPKRDVAVGNRVRGPADAPITIVEFSDYECQFCKRAEPSVRQVLETYEGKIRFSYRDFPLAFHANARLASEAAQCANAQGKFWEFHEKLMDGGDLAAPALETTAVELGMDKDKFATCLADGTYKAEIDRDMADGAAAGVNGTPAFFINGRQIDGAQPFEAFRDIIEEELAWAKKAGTQN
jgi:protein-disulfide isomerase